MLATVGWGRRGFSEIKLFSRDDNDDNDDNNNDEEEEKLSYAETKSSISNNNNKSGEKGEKNSKSYHSSFSSSSEINCIEWSKSNGNCVACGTSDGRVVVLDKELTFIGEVKEEEGEKRRRRRIGAISSSLTTTGSLKEEEDVMNDYDEFEVKSMDFHSSSRYLAVGGTSGVVNVWDLKTRRVSRRLDATARNNGDTAAGIVVNAVKFNRDDRVIACGTEQGEIVLHKGGERFDEEEEEKSETDRRCCSSEPPLSAFDVNESTSVNCLDFSPHRRMMLAAGTSSGDLNVYDCESESLETRFRSSDANNIIRSIAFSPTAPRIIAVANDDGSVSLRDVAMHPKTGVCLHIPNPNKRWMQSSSKNGVIFGTAGAASSVSWHPSGQALAVGYRGNGVVAMYDCRSLRSHMDERKNNNSNNKYDRRTSGSNNDRFDSSGSEEYPRALFETEAHEGGRVIALKWQPPVAKTTKTKKTTSSNANAYYDGGSDKENKIENNIEQKQQKKKKAHPKEAEEDATEAMRKSLENLNAKTTTTTTATQQQQMMITADAISDEVCKKTREVVKVCLEKEVKSLRADVRNLHVELLRAQEENASMFRKLHEQQLELMDALNSSSHNKINGKTDAKY